jgi:adenylate kinase
MRIILLGAPGAGKGSQAAKITAQYHIPHISTGDAFRSNIAKGTEVGKLAKTYMDKGLLVPDEVTVNIVAARIAEDDCKNGFLLDGFPRTIPQADTLARLTDIDAVINIEVDHTRVLNRLTGRRSCTCGACYHISSYKGKSCEKCGRELYIREDDKENVIVKRLEAYNQMTAPLVDYYRAKGKLFDIDGNRSIEQTFLSIKAVLK